MQFFEVNTMIKKILSAFLLTILIAVPASNTYAYDDNSQLYDEAYQEASKILAESEDYVLNFLEQIDETISADNINLSVGDFCLLTGLQIELPNSIAECEPNGALFEVKNSESTIALMSIVKRDGVYSRSTIMGGKQAQEFKSAKQKISEISDEYVVLSMGKERFFYSVVDEKEVIYPMGEYSTNAETYMKSAEDELLLIEKQDFQSMLYQMQEDVNNGLIGGGLMSYLPEKAYTDIITSRVNNNITPIIIVAVGIVLVATGIIFSKRRKAKLITHKVY